MPSEAGMVNLGPNLSKSMQAPPPPYVLFHDLDGPQFAPRRTEQIQYPPGFVPPPPPPPLPPRIVPTPHAAPQPAHSPDEGPWMHDGTPSPQYEIMSSAPSTSYGSSRRPLPFLPGHSSSGNLPTRSSETRSNTQSDSYSSRSADHNPPRFPASPSGGAPPAFMPSPSRPTLPLSPERLAQELPPTPSTSSSGSVRQRQHRQSQQSFQSLSSSISPARSPASFNTNEPPPWAIPYHEGGLSQHPTLTPDNHQFLRVNVSSDPGHVVSSKSKLFDLCMHKGDQNTAPSYGRGEPVEGYVDLKVFDNIAEIDVTLSGALQVVYSERGMAHDQVTVPLFTESKTLYTSAYNRAPSQSHAFTFTFPDKCVASNTPLPPTWSLSQPGVTAEVAYTIRATLKRKGLLRKDEKVVAKVEYYPRTAPPLPEPSSPDRPKKPKFRVLEIDQNLRPTGRNAVDKPMIPTTFTARISLHLPLVYASGSTIPYTVYLVSPIHTAVPASLDVEVSIIKTSRVVLHGKPCEKKDVVAKGSNMDKQFELGHRRANTNNHEAEGGTLTVKGSCIAGTEGEEMSWSVEGVASISYAMRFVIMPAQQISEFANFKDTLPTFEHSEEITLTTDQSYTLMSDVEARLPARGVGHRRMRSNTANTGLAYMSSRNSSNAGDLSSMGGPGSYAGSIIGSPVRENAGRDSLHGARRVISRPRTGGSRMAID